MKSNVLIDQSPKVEISAIGEAVNNVNRQLKELEESLQVHNERISPILCPCAAEKENAHDTPQPPQSKVAETINSFARTIGKQASFVRAMTERLEV